MRPLIMGLWLTLLPAACMADERTCCGAEPVWIAVPQPAWKPTPASSRIPRTPEGIPEWAETERAEFVLPAHQPAPRQTDEQTTENAAAVVAVKHAAESSTHDGWVPRSGVQNAAAQTTTTSEQPHTAEAAPVQQTQGTATPPPPPPLELHTLPDHPAALHDAGSPIIEPLMEPVPEMAVPIYVDEHHHAHDADCQCLDCEKFGPLKRFKFYANLPTCDAGIGHERVQFAPFQIETAEPIRNIRTRFDAAYGLTAPDRAEYFWAASGEGPAIPEGKIDYFDFRYITESGGDKLSFVTDIPVRVLDYGPDTSTGGLSHISMATKTAIVTGDDWYVSSIFRLYLPVGSETRGTANGHLSLEPGILSRYRYNDELYFHGQLKWWIPMGGNSEFDGQVLNYGFGLSYILYETDAYAVLPTLELDGWSVMSGKQTLPDGTVTSIGGDNFMNILGGIRYVLGPAGDLGLFEFGVTGGIHTGDVGWYSQLLRVELRWTY